MNTLRENEPLPQSGSDRRDFLRVTGTPQEMLWGTLIVVVDGEGSGTAAKFAQWLTSDDAQAVDYFNRLGLPPTTTAALDSADVVSNTFVSDFTTKVTVDAKPSPLWPYVKSAQMETAIAEQVQALLIGQSSPASSPADAMKAAGKTVRTHRLVVAESPPHTATTH